MEATPQRRARTSRTAKPEAVTPEVAPPSPVQEETKAPVQPQPKDGPKKRQAASAFEIYDY